MNNNSSNLPSLHYKERDSPTNHVKEVYKNVGEQGHLQSLIETFIGQASHWWGTHQFWLQLWTTTSTYFIQRFKGKKLIVEAHINKFLPDNKPNEHINSCEKEWKIMGYHEKWIWTHLFPSTLNYLPNNSAKNWGNPWWCPHLESTKEKLY